MQSEALTHEIIGAAMEVHKCLGPGFLESIYKQALLHELRLKGIGASSEVEVAVQYKNCVVGKHRLDFLVDGKVVVELKAIAGIAPVHLAQTLSYLKATGAGVGLVINFGEPSLRWKRLLKPQFSQSV